MRIAYFCGKYPYTQKTDIPDDSYFCGGSIIAAFKLVNEMVEKNIECYVFTTSYNHDKQIEKDQNLEIIHFPTTIQLLTSNISLRLIFDPLDYSADIVHVHFDLPPTPFWGYRYAMKKNKPLIITYHGDWSDNYGNFFRKIIVKMINFFIVDKMLSRADIIISPSLYYINESRFLKKYEKKIRVIPNGVDTDHFKIEYSKSECKKSLGLPEKSTVVLYLGALTPRKGPDVLIKSMQIVTEKDPTILLLICGTGEMEYSLKNLVKSLHLENNVKFCGFVDEKIKHVYYKAADVFCLPSTVSTEVFPLVLLEAAACGLPLIVSDLETFKCIVTNGQNGYFSRKGDVPDLAEKIDYLTHHQKERLSLGSNARSFAEQFSWSKIADMTFDCYCELMEIKKSDEN